MKGACQEGGPGGFDGAPALVGVNVVRPGRCTLTPRARRRGVAPVRAAGRCASAGGGGRVADTGPGSGWSDVPVTGGRPAALDNRVARSALPGPPPVLVRRPRAGGRPRRRAAGAGSASLPWGSCLRRRGGG